MKLLATSSLFALLLGSTFLPLVAFAQAQPPTPISFLVYVDNGDGTAFSANNVYETYRTNFNTFKSACSAAGGQTRVTFDENVRECAASGADAELACQMARAECVVPVTGGGGSGGGGGSSGGGGGAATPVTTGSQSASESFIPLTNLPGLTEAANSSSLPAFFNNLYKLCIGAAAVIAILQIMRAGTKFFFNKGSVAQNEEGKQLIQNSVLGLLLVLSPAIVFGIINPDILQLKLDVSRLETQAPTPATTTPMLVNRVLDLGTAAACALRYTQIQAQQGGQCDRNQGLVSVDPDSGCCAGITSGGVCCGKPTGTGLGVAAPTGPITVRVYKDRFGANTRVDDVYPTDRDRYTAFRDGCVSPNQPRGDRQGEVRCPDQNQTDPDIVPACVNVRMECFPPAR